MNGGGDEVHWAGRSAVEEAADRRTAGAGRSADVRSGAGAVEVVVEALGIDFFVVRV